MEKLVCIAECPELDCDSSKHCIDTKEGIREKEDRTCDYCPCGNVAIWEALNKEFV